MIKKKNGFTLVELLVTISILAVLSSIAIVAYSGITMKARDNQRIKDLQAIKQALELYRSDIHNYPTTDNFVLKIASQLTSCTGVSPCNVLSTYLLPVPKDPKDSDNTRNYYYLALPNSPVCNNTSANTACSNFILCAKREGTDASNDLEDCKSLLSGSCGANTSCDIGISSQ